VLFSVAPPVLRVNALVPIGYSLLSVWEEGSYELMVVYITHGLTGEQGYQLTNKESLRPVQVNQMSCSGCII
jgi:hypothetical protein